MPQGLGKNLYLELSVYDNVDFMAQLFGLPAAERRTRIRELLDATGLGPVRGSARRQALRRHEAEGRAVRRAGPRSRSADPRRADDRRRPAVAPAVLAAHRQHSRGPPGDERGHLDGVHGRSAGVGLDRRHGRGARAGDGLAGGADEAHEHERSRALLHRAPARREAQRPHRAHHPAARGRKDGDRHRGARPDLPLRRLHRGRLRVAVDRARRDLRLSRLERLRQVDDHEDADRPSAADGGDGEDLRQLGRRGQPRGAQEPRLHDAGVLALRRAQRAAEPGAARAALSPARGQGPKRASRSWSNGSACARTSTRWPSRCRWGCASACRWRSRCCTSRRS